ncbi:MAG: TRAP transporter substrate-binding protein [Desulfobacteraceae bacterium]|nr:TRAP transporter substrate-binding protein [Desulfobacteraceae bacterium]
MQKRWMTILTVLLFATTLMAGLTTLATETLAKDKPIIVKMTNNIPKYPPSRNPGSIWYDFIARKLEAKSKGRFKVKIYWGGSLYKDDATQYAAIRDNVVQVGLSTGGRMGSEIPEINLYALPFMFKNMEHVRRFYFGPKGFNPQGGPAAKLYDPLFAKQGYKLITFVPVGFQNFTSSKGFLEKPDVFKGVKFRIRPSKLAAEIMEAFGGSAMVIPFMESYTALSLGTVDAGECPLYLMYATKWYETGNYVTISRHSMMNTAILTNPTFYNSLPPDLKKVWDDTFEEGNQFYFKIVQDMEMMMPWIMMSQRPSLQFKWLSEEQRKKLKEHVKPLLDKYRKTIPKEFWDAVEATRPK